MTQATNARVQPARLPALPGRSDIYPHELAAAPAVQAAP